MAGSASPENSDWWLFVVGQAVSLRADCQSAPVEADKRLAPLLSQARGLYASCKAAVRLSLSFQAPPELLLLNQKGNHSRFIGVSQ
jgi:hypothetical protein